MSLFQLFPLLIAPFVLLSILWCTIRYGISPMPSNAKVRRAMVDLVPTSTPAQLLELGSGWGTLADELASRYPNSIVTGYERSLIPFWFSRLYFQRHNLRFEYNDFRTVAFPLDSVLVCYLYPQGMQEVTTLPHTKHCWLISNT